MIYAILRRGLFAVAATFAIVLFVAPASAAEDCPRGDLAERWKSVV